MTGSEVTIEDTSDLLVEMEAKESIIVPVIIHNGGPFWVRTRDLSLIRTAL